MRNTTVLADIALQAIARAADTRQEVIEVTVKTRLAKPYGRIETTVRVVTQDNDA